MSRNFSPEFKTEAASKVLDEGMSIRIACETFGVGDTAMRRWVKQLAEERTGEVPQGSKPITPEQQRIRELESQVRQLQEEKEILKKPWPSSCRNRLASSGSGNEEGLQHDPRVCSVWSCTEYLLRLAGQTDRATFT